MAKPQMAPSMMALLLVLAIAAAGGADAQEAGKPVSSPPPAVAPAEGAWSGGFATYLYLQEDDDFLLTILGADRGSLHLEGRFQYEDLETGSLWAGWTFEAGTTVQLQVTPMAGVDFGQTNGFAPGLELTLAWRSLELYSESEYVIDADDSSESFLYNWSELTLAPVESFRFGLVVQRTRAYQTERDVQRGLIVGYAYKQADFTLCLFNPDDDKPSVAFSVGFRF